MSDWVRLHADIFSLKEFDILCARTQCSNGEMIALLFRTAAWFEKYGTYGQMSSKEALAIDGLLKKQGFLAILMDCGWAKEDGGMTRLSGFCMPSATRKSIGSSVRREVLARGSCVFCGSKNELVVDHATPVVRGGTGDRSNLQCLCAPCNRAKGRKTMAEFMELRGVK